MENYIMVNGKKIELNNEKLMRLYNAKLILPEDIIVSSGFNPAERKIGERYYTANSFYMSDGGIDQHAPVDNTYFEYANYWNDKAFAKHVALSQLLYRKLLQYAYLNDLVDDKPWDGETAHSFIAQHVAGRFFASYTWNGKMPCTVYFKDDASANKAIEEVVEPFVVAHPDFRIIW